MDFDVLLTAAELAALGQESGDQLVALPEDRRGPIGQDGPRLTPQGDPTELRYQGLLVASWNHDL